MALFGFQKNYISQNAAAKMAACCNQFDLSAPGRNTASPSQAIQMFLLLTTELCFTV